MTALADLFQLIAGAIQTFMSLLSWARTGEASAFLSAIAAAS